MLHACIDKCRSELLKLFILFLIIYKIYNLFQILVPNNSAMKSEYLGTITMLILFAILMTSTLASPIPVTFMDDIVYTTNNTLYTAQYDIVDVHLPVHFFEEHKIFFVEADVTDGNKYKGLFALNNTDDNKTVNKLLENGKCITSDAEAVYFGATDGIYKYNFNNDTVEKYGTINADIRDIEKAKSKDLIYIVTEDNRLYLVTEQANKMVEHDTIKNVQEIAIDSKNNLYYYEKHDDPENYMPFYKKYSKPKIMVDHDIIEVSGLPDKYTYIKLVSILNGDHMLAVVSNNIYEIFPNGTSKDTRVMFLDNPTAYSLDAGLVQVYGHDKKLYCFVVRLDLVIKAFVEAIGKALNAFVKALTSNS